MKKILLVILVMQILIESTTAQPGGGGGVRIVNILDYTGKPILKGDSALQIQLYALSKDAGKQRFQIAPGQENNHRFYDRAHTFYYLPPYIRNGNKNINLPNQRL